MTVCRVCAQPRRVWWLATQVLGGHLIWLTFLYINFFVLIERQSSYHYFKKKNHVLLEYYLGMFGGAPAAPNPPGFT
jgi:hypothetical protein